MFYVPTLSVRPGSVCVTEVLGDSEDLESRLSAQDSILYASAPNPDPTCDVPPKYGRERRVHFELSSEYTLVRERTSRGASANMSMSRLVEGQS